MIPQGGVRQTIPPEAYAMVSCLKFIMSMPVARLSFLASLILACMFCFIARFLAFSNIPPVTDNRKSIANSNIKLALPTWGV